MEPGPQGVPSGQATPTSERLATLQDLTLEELRAEWRRLYRSPPPRLSRDLMQRGVAYRIQEKAFGGLSPASRRRLKQLSGQRTSSDLVIAEVRQAPQPGARLVREWNGRTYTVAVTDEGFAYAGTVYGSLTKVARAITGSHWSGPRFFGLTASRPPAVEGVIDA